MIEMLNIIMLACQLNGGSLDLVEKQQLDCQQKLINCMMQKIDDESHFINCLAKRKLK